MYQTDTKMHKYAIYDMTCLNVSVLILKRPKKCKNIILLL